MLPSNTGDCLIELTLWAVLTVHCFSRLSCFKSTLSCMYLKLVDRFVFLSFFRGIFKLKMRQSYVKT